MSANTRNPNVDNTAARHLAKAMAAVHPAQRRELLAAMRGHIDDAVLVLNGESHTPAPDFFANARELLGVELVAH